MNKNNKKGFTLAELLIVVAIIGVLVAISIPIFTAQLEKAREAVDLANIRSAYAEAASEVLTNGGTDVTKTVTDVKQTTSGWTTAYDSVAGVTSLPDIVKGNTVYVTAHADGSAPTISTTAPAGD